MTPKPRLQCEPSTSLAADMISLPLRPRSGTAKPPRLRACTAWPPAPRRAAAVAPTPSLAPRSFEVAMCGPDADAQGSAGTAARSRPGHAVQTRPPVDLFKLLVKSAVLAAPTSGRTRADVM
eukprot:6184868-Pleurochrysis_carterae.AAC.2